MDSTGSASMIPNFRQTVFALTQSLLEERHRPVGTAMPDPTDVVADFLVGQQARMTDYLRLPLRTMTLLFDAAAIPFTGRPFHSASAAQRARQIRAWRSALGTQRDFIKFYESLALFAWYSVVYSEGSNPDD